MGPAGSLKRIIGLGAGGHARVMIDILRLTGEFELVGLLDVSPELWGTHLDGVPVLGDDSLLARLHRQGIRHAFIGLGSTGNSDRRRLAYQRAKDVGFQMVRAVHPSAVVAASATLEDGVSVMANAVVNPGAWLAENVIVNTGAIVEHDCTVQKHAHIAPGARLGGNVLVGEGAHVGIGACIIQGLRVGNGSIVGAGAVVVDDVPGRVVVAGVPARILRSVGT